MSPIAVHDDLAGQPLTARELQILRLLAQGRTDGSIGKELFLSAHTVKTHVRRLAKKLGASGRAAAVAQGYEQRWLIPGRATTNHNHEKDGS